MQKNRLAWRVAAFAAVSLLLVLAAQQALTPSGQFSANPPMSAARQGAASALLSDGRILVTGGQDSTGPLASAEFLSGATAGTMATPRYAHIAVALKDGTVLVAGGRTTGDAVTNAAELYAGGAWTPISAMLVARAGATATLLQDGRVLIAGGQSSGGALQTTEIFDPASGQFNNGPPMSTVRQNHAAALLLDGRVILAGGSDGANALAGIDLFDPATGAIAPFATMSAARDGLSATTLMSGKVLLAGGTVSGNASASTEILDVTAAATAPGPAMSTARTAHMALLLPNNNTVLMAGGTTASAAAEIFVEWQNAFAPFGSLSSARTAVTGGASSQSASAAVAGGVDSSGAVSAAVDAVRFPMVTTDKPDYQPGDTATITGSGFAPNEIVNVIINEVVDIDHDSPITLTPAPQTDASGSFTVQFPINVADLNVHFYLNATGQTSGLTAGMSFTDNKDLTLTFAGTGAGSVVASDTTDSTKNKTILSTCSGNACKVTTGNNDVGTLTATANPGSVFSGWSLATAGVSGCTGTTSPCNFSMGNAAQSVTATFNTAPKLTVTKVLVGGSAADKFNLLINSVTYATDISNGGTTGAQSGTVGSNTFGETAGTGTTLADFTTVISGTGCTDNGNGTGSITLATGDNKTCTITNTKKAKLTITKVLVPSGDSGLFNLLINSVTDATNIGNGGTTGAKTATTGSNTFGETAGTSTSLSDYTTVISGTGCTDNGNGTGSITLAAGDNLKCTITNTKKAKLTVNKVTVPSSDTGKFNLQIDGSTAGTGANQGNGGTTGAVVTSVGSHTVSETAGTGSVLTDYTSVISGDCAADGTITLAAGDVKVCTITNTRKPMLTVNKVTVPSSDTGKFNLQIDGSTAGTGANQGNGGTTGAVVTSVGAHTVSETAGTGSVLTDYASVISGDCAADGTITLAAGDVKVCTITNTRKPKLTVNKVTVPSSDTGKFNLQIDASTAGTGANQGNGGTTGAVLTTVGSHTVSETAGTGSVLTDYTSVISGDCAADGTITLAAADVKVCTITNTRKPRLTVNKVTVPTSDTGKFNLQIDSSTAGTGANQGNGGTTGVVVTSIGSHTVSETAGTGSVLTDYTSAISGDCAADGTITLAAGDVKVCTITNTRKPKLTVNKVTVPSSDTGKFNLQIDSSTAGTGANQGNGGTTGVVVTSIGSHTVSETAGTGSVLTDYTSAISGDCAADGTITLAAGDVKVCTITNTRKPKLTVNKITVPSSDTGKFNLQIDGSTAGTGANQGNGGTTGAVIVTIASHTVSETAGTGSVLTDYTSAISGDCAADGTITLAAGDNKTCTITNTRKPKLTVNKVTVPSNDTGKFNLQIDGSTAGTGANQGNGGTTGAVIVTIASHTVSETAGAGSVLTDYTSAISGDCAADGSVTLAAGDNKTCTITNTRKPKLTVNKTTVPSSDTGKFNLQIDGSTAGTGANQGNGGTTGAVLTSVGSHTVSETAGTGSVLTDYTSAISGDCAVDGTITLAAGDVKTCTITNTRKPKLTVNKVTVPVSDTGQFNLQIDGSTAGTGANQGNGGTTGAVLTSVGMHTVGETAGAGSVLTDYTSAISGDCAVDGTITLAAGDVKTCTITNTRKPRLTVNKATIPSNDTGKFNLQIDGGTAGTGANQGNGGTTGVVVTSIGSHTVGETAGAGSVLTDYTAVISGDCAADGTITLAAGDVKTCTITNTRKPKLTVSKITVPSNDTGLFNLQIDGVTAGSGGNVGNGGSTGAVIVTIGSHTVSEAAGTGSVLSDYISVIGGDCAADGTITLAAGDMKLCTITNTRKPKLTVSKLTVPSSDTGLFNLQIDGSTAGTGANQGNGGTTGAVIVTIGSHTVSEMAGTGSVLSDYISVISGDCAADGTITLAAGDNKTCIITNTRKPKLTVTKTLLPNNDPGLFNLQIDGGTAGTGGNVGNGGTTGAVIVTIASHTVGETAGTGTSLSDYESAIGGDCAANGSITLAAGDNKTCTITNRRKPKLTVNKITVPSSDTGKFNLQIDGSTAGTGANQGNGGTTGVVVTSIGSHTVGETAGAGSILDDYISVISGDCAADGSITLAPGDIKVCTITNTRKPKLTITKVLVPNTDGGLFNLLINSVTDATNIGNTGTTGAQYGIIGSNSFSETAGTSTSLSDYIAVVSGTGCTDNGSGTGSITLAAGDAKTCTITNTRKGYIKITKSTSGGDGTFGFGVSGPNAYSQSASIMTTGGSGTSTPTFEVVPGAGYSVTETVPNGWSLTSVSCSNGGVLATTNGGAFTVGPGVTVTCAFNDATAYVKVSKTTITTPSDTTTQFSVTISPTGGTVAQAATETVTGGSSFTYQVSPGGTYSVSEAATTGWFPPGYSNCTGLSPTAGQTLICTITNTKKPTLTVTKTLLPGGDSGTFNLMINGTTYATGGNGTTTGAQYANIGSNAIGETAFTGTNLANYFVLFGGDCAADGTITLVAGQNASCTITNVLATVTVTTTATNSTGSQPQYSDPVTFKAVVSADTTVISPALAGSVTFYVGTPGPAGETSMGSCNLSTDGSGDLTCSVMAPLVDPGTPPQRPPTGNFAPGAHTVYAVFGGVSPAVNAAAKPTTPLTINQEDAQATYTGLEYFGAPAGATTMDVTVSYSLQDATATCPSAICDAYAGDITNAKVTLTLTGVSPSFTGSCSPLPVLAVAGAVDPTNMAPSTGTVSCVIHNVPVPGSYNVAATPATGSYYAFLGETSMAITTSNNGTGFITGGGHQTAAYLATPGAAGSGKYTTAGLLKPAPGTKMNFGFETKYNKSGSNLQGGANIIVRSACVAGIAGYTPVPGDDGLCVYQIKTNGNGNITSLAENLTPKPPYAAFTARNVAITDVTRPIALPVTGNANLQLTMYDVAEPGANMDTLAIQVTDNVNGLWISNNWSGATTAISPTAPVINGGNLQVH